MWRRYELACEALPVGRERRQEEDQTSCMEQGNKTILRLTLPQEEEKNEALFY